MINYIKDNKINYLLFLNILMRYKIYFSLIQDIEK